MSGSAVSARAVREYWNSRIHDLEMTDKPPGSKAFFQELDDYRFDKLAYLPNVIDFAAYRGQRLVEVGRKAGCGYAQLVQRAADIDWRALDGARAVGITAGASAPEVLVEEVIAAFRARFEVTERLVETARESVEFKVPRVLRAKTA